MTLTLLRLLLVPLWMAGLWGSLQVHQLDLNLGHSICGAWGCGPPVEALIGYHGFWLFLILPLAICVGAFLPSPVNRKVGLAVLLAGIVGVISFVGWDAFTYARKVDSTQYLLQRCLFTLVTTVDFPMLQTVLAGGVLAAVFGRKTISNDEARFATDNDTADPSDASQVVGQ